MNLELNKAIAFFDLETTGLDVSVDRIVEISILRIEVNGDKNIITRRLNPEIPISPESTAIHGISNEDVADQPNFKTAGPELKQFIGNADLAGYNSNKFDIPMLVEEFDRAGIDFDVSKRKMIDVQNIFHKMEQRTLVAAYKFYCGKDLTQAHSAQADIEATYEILEAQLSKYTDLERNAAFLHQFSKMKDNVDLAGRMVYNDKKEEVFNFGKYKGQSVKAVLQRDPSYYNWMMDANFPSETKKVLTRLKLELK